VQTMRTHKKLYFDCSKKYEMHLYPKGVFCFNSWDFLNFFKKYENNKFSIFVILYEFYKLRLNSNFCGKSTFMLFEHAMLEFFLSHRNMFFD
jgi:hypothetical protein